MLKVRQKIYCSTLVAKATPQFHGWPTICQGHFLSLAQFAFLPNLPRTPLVQTAPRRNQIDGLGQLLAIHAAGIVPESDVSPDAAWSLPVGTARKLQSVWY